MLEKIGNILSSVRFWQLVLGAVLLILASYGVIPQQIADVIASLLGISVVVGSVDKFSQK